MKNIIYTSKCDLASALIQEGLSNALATYVAFMLMPEGVTIAVDAGPSGEFLGKFEIVGTFKGPQHLVTKVADALDQASARDDHFVKVIGAHASMEQLVFRLTCSYGPDSPDAVEAAQYMELANKFHKERH